MFDRAPKMRPCWQAIFSVLLLVAGASVGGATPRAPATWYQNLPVILTHTHVLPIGSDGQRHVDEAVSSALRQLDEFGVRATIIMPTPAPGSDDRAGDLDWLVGIVKEHPGRFLLAGGGTTLNGMIEATPPGRVSPEDIAAFTARAEEIIAQGAIGFGETTALHFSAFEGHPFEETQPDHPLYLLLADLAARFDVPLDIHMEAVTQTWTVSADFTARSAANPVQVDENITAFERLLAHNARAKIIWVHLGMDTTGQRTPDLTQRLLAAHPNLFISISGLQRINVGVPLLQRGRGLNPQWRAVIEKYPDRFMIGGDTFFLPPDPRREFPPLIVPATRIIRIPALTPAVARMLAFENAQVVFGLELINVDDVPLPPQ